MCRKGSNVEKKDDLSRLISLLKKETNTDKSREKVASVFHSINQPICTHPYRRTVYPLK